MARNSSSRKRKQPSISSESSFYGSEDERSKLESQCQAFNPTAYLNRPANAVEQALRLRPHPVEVKKLPSKPPARELGYVKWPKPQVPTDPKPAPASVPTPEPVPAPEPSKTLAPLFNPYEHESSAWQIGEACADFLHRLPPSRTLESNAGPWIWVANPTSSRRETRSDYRSLREDGEQILQELAEKKEEFGRKGAARYESVRTQAQEAILSAGRTHGVTTGKWLLFRHAREIDEAWTKVAMGTIQGKLGCAAKVATRKSLGQGSGGDGAEQVICVYTEDFADEADVVRVLRELHNCGLVRRAGGFGKARGIYYKPDVYTHLGILSGNEWGIPPTLYASTTFIPLNSKSQRGA